jgi:hypothetical protein
VEADGVGVGVGVVDGDGVGTGGLPDQNTLTVWAAAVPWSRYTSALPAL